MTTALLDRPREIVDGSARRARARLAVLLVAIALVGGCASSPDQVAPRLRLRAGST